LINFQKIQDLRFLFCFGHQKEASLCILIGALFFGRTSMIFLLLRATKISILIGRPTLKLLFSG